MDYVRAIYRDCIRSLDKIRRPVTYSMCMHTRMRLIGRYPAVHACMHSHLHASKKRLCGVEFVHEVMQAGADSGFDWLHWPRYVATGAQESMHAVLARQPAEVVQLEGVRATGKEAALAQVCRYGRPGVHACCARPPAS